jgi:hypothetical protein
VVVQAAGLKDAKSAFEAQLADKDLTLTKYKVGLSKGLPEALINGSRGPMRLASRRTRTS